MVIRVAPSRNFDCLLTTDYSRLPPISHRLALLVGGEEVGAGDAAPERFALGGEGLDRVEVGIEGEALPRTRSDIAAIGRLQPLHDRLGCPAHERDHRLAV